MPFQSEAQRRYFHWAKGQGKISPKTVKEWEEHTPEGKKLPERVHKKKASVRGAFVAAFLDEFNKLGVQELMHGIPEPMQEMVRRRAAQAHAVASAPPSGFTRKKLTIAAPKTPAAAQQRMSVLGRFIRSRGVRPRL